MWKKFPSLSHQDLQRLNAFFADERLIDAQIPLVGIHGFLVAVLSNPHSLPAHVWLSVIFNQRTRFRSPEMLKSVIRLLLRWYRQIKVELISQHLHLLVSVDNPVLEATEAPEKNIVLWCHGYLAGMQLDSDAWRSREDALALTFPIGVLVGDVLLENILDIHGIPINAQELKNKSQALLPIYIQRLFTYWKTYPLNTPTALKSRSETQLCPCGSQKPFIYCCGNPGRMLH